MSNGKKFAAGCGGLIVALIIVRVILAVIAANRMADYEKNVWQKDLAAAHARLDGLRMPVIEGASLDEDSTKAWWSLGESLSSVQGPDLGVIASGAAIVPPAALPEAAAKLLEAHRKEVAAFRENARRTRCTWSGMDLDKGFETKLPNLIGARVLANLVLMEGVERASAGDAAGAVARDLEVVRMGADYAEAPTLITAMIGVAIESIGIKALGRIVTSTVKDVPYDSVRQGLEKLAPVRPSAGRGIEGELLMAGSLGKMTREHLSLWKTVSGSAEGSELGVLGVVLPVETLYASAQSELDGHYRALAKAAEKPRSEREAEMKAITDRAVASWNPIVKIVIPNLLVAANHVDELIALERMVALAALVESKRAADGTYPAANALEIPEDPCAPGSKLRYEPSADRKLYRISSAGTSSRPDLVVERTSPRG